MTKARKPKRINSRSKGISGELEAIAFMRGLGFATTDRRIQPRGGKVDGPDFFILKMQPDSFGVYSIESNAVAVEVKRDPSPVRAPQPSGVGSEPAPSFGGDHDTGDVRAGGGAGAARPCPDRDDAGVRGAVGPGGDRGGDEGLLSGDRTRIARACQPARLTLPIGGVA